MARGGVNKAVVKIARNTLLARGVHPSIDAVRVELGNTGSKTTIQRYLKELSEAETPEPEMPLDEELVRYIGSLVERLKQAAHSALARDRAAFEREQTAARHQREIEQAGIEQLQQAHASLTEAHREGVAHEQTLTDQLKSCELERQRLHEAHQQQLRLLEERAAQVISLEQKHRYTQEALEHFRTEHVQQREQELQRHDQQILQLQREARTALEQMRSKQDELGQLYLDLERMSAEQRRSHQEIYRLENALQTGKEQLQAAQLERESELRQKQGVEHQLTTLREKARQQAIKQRVIQRELRGKEQHIKRLQTLLEQMTQPAPKDND